MSTEVLDLLDQRGAILRAPVPTASPSGVTRKTWSTTVASNVPTSVQRASGRLVQNDAGQMVEATFRALFLQGVDVRAGDRLRVSGTTYDVLLVHTLTALLPHLEAYLAVATPGVA